MLGILLRFVPTRRSRTGFLPMAHQAAAEGRLPQDVVLLIFPGMRLCLRVYVFPLIVLNDTDVLFAFAYVSIGGQTALGDRPSFAKPICDA